MPQDSRSASDLLASSPNVTILTDGLSGAAGIAARGLDDAQVIPVADAMTAGVPSNAIVAVSDTQTVVDVLNLFYSTASPDASIRLVMVDSLAVNDLELVAALAQFDVPYIDTRAACAILTLQATSSQQGSAVRWSRQLSQAHDSADGLDRPRTESHRTPAGQRVPVAGRDSGLGRFRRVARWFVTRPIMLFTIAAVTMIVISYLSLSSFPDRPAATLLSVVFGILLLGLGGLVLASLLRARRSNAATAKVQRSIEQSSKRIKTLEDQVRSLRSSIGAATSTMGAGTAAINELLRTSPERLSPRGSVGDPTTARLGEQLSDLTGAVALIDHKLNSIQERIDR